MFHSQCVSFPFFLPFVIPWGLTSRVDKRSSACCGLPHLKIRTQYTITILFPNNSWPGCNVFPLPKRRIFELNSRVKSNGFWFIIIFSVLPFFNFHLVFMDIFQRLLSHIWKSLNKKVCSPRSWDEWYPCILNVSNVTKCCFVSTCIKRTALEMPFPCGKTQFKNPFLFYFWCVFYPNFFCEEVAIRIKSKNYYKGEFQHLK